MIRVVNRRVTSRRARRVVMSDDADDELLTTVLFLINRGYWLALYELYVDARRTNALEKDLPARNTLRSFFGDRQRFPADVFSAVRDAFDSGVSAARVIEAESRAALAEYDLRLAREDAAAAGALVGAGTGSKAEAAPEWKPRDATRSFRHWLCKARLRVLALSHSQY